MASKYLIFSGSEDWYSINGRIESMYNQAEKNRGVIVCPLARTERIRLENAVIKYGGNVLRISGLHEIVSCGATNDRGAMKKNIPYLESVFNRVSFRRNNDFVEGNYEINGVYYGFGRIADMDAPISIFAESAEIIFQSEYCAKASDSAGNIRKYNNATLNLQEFVAVIKSKELKKRETIVRNEKPSFQEVLAVTSAGTSSLFAYLNQPRLAVCSLVVCAIFGLRAVENYLDDKIDRYITQGRELSLAFAGRLATKPMGS